MEEIRTKPGAHQLQFDVREDEEQLAKLAETIELLVAAGYFRARIKGLSAFDKVVGGITWCASLCDYDIDVDLFYQENSTIGQKIALTERIVRVLPTMKCPHVIEPHQIQGLDMIHIFPVVQWLVRKAIEVRSQTEDTLKAFAISRFDANHSWPTNGDELKRKNRLEQSIGELRETFGPQRVFKRKDPEIPLEEDVHVSSTLLEYEGKLQSSTTSTSKSSEDRKSKEESPVENLLESMSELSRKEVKISAASVAAMIDRQAIQRMADSYEQRETVSVEPESIERTLVNLRLRQQHLRDHLATLREREDQMKQMVEAAEAERAKLQLDVDQLNAQLQHFEQLETSVDPEQLETMKTLMEQHEVIKREEQQFKQSCRLELERLKSRIEWLKATDNGEVEETISDELLQQHRLVSDQLKSSRLSMATLNQQLARLQRKVDEVPSRAELNQYQRRFLELNNQITARLRETKQFYTMYNTLVDVKVYTEKEISLLDSVYDNYHRAMDSDENKILFLKQLDGIVNGIKQSKQKVERQQADEKAKRDALQVSLSEMNDRERLYYKSVKDFQEECRKNESLIAQLKELGVDDTGDE